MVEKVFAPQIRHLAVSVLASPALGQLLDAASGAGFLWSSPDASMLPRLFGVAPVLARLGGVIAVAVQ